MLIKDQFVTQGCFLFRWRSYLPLLLVPPALIALPQSGYMDTLFGARAEEVWDIFAVFVALVGLAIRVATVGFVPAGTSGRNTKSQRAETLNTTGLYSVVRNPLYLGNGIVLLGLALSIKVWWLVLLVSACALIYYERIICAEETFLQGKFGDAYEAWAARTPAIVPNLRLWRRPQLRFSVRAALRREYHGFFLIVVAMVLFEAASDVFGEGIALADWARDEFSWLMFLLSGFLVYLTIRLIRKRTTWLVVAGR